MTKRQYKFIRTKGEIKSLRNVFKRFRAGDNLTVSDRKILYDNGLINNLDVKFFDQDMDNVIKNLVTVVIDSKIERIPEHWYSYAAFKVMNIRPINREFFKVHLDSIERALNKLPK